MTICQTHGICYHPQITGAAPHEEALAATAAAASEGTETPEGETQQQADGTGDGNGMRPSPETETETAAQGGEFVWVVMTQGEQRANADWTLFLIAEVFREMGALISVSCVSHITGRPRGSCVHVVSVA